MAKKQSYLKSKQTFSGAQVLLFVMIFALVGAVAIFESFAAKAPTGSCNYSTAAGGGVVTASGLPTETVVNFFMHDNVTGDQSGWVLGITHDGNWSVNVPVPTHSSTYDFVSKTYGKNGSKYNIYAECTQAV